MEEQNMQIYIEPSDLNYIIIKIKEEMIEKRGSVYETTRRAWHAKLSTAEPYKYVLSVISGVVCEVFEVEKWQMSNEENRIEFIGHVAPQHIADYFKGKMIPEKYRVKGLASPFLYKRVEEGEATMPISQNLSNSAPVEKAAEENDFIHETEKVNEDFSGNEENDDWDGDWCDNVSFKGILYSCSNDDYSADADLFEDEDLETSKIITIPSTIVDPETGKKYQVTGYSINDGQFNTINLPDTIKYISGWAFSDMEEETLSKIQIIMDNNQNIVIKDRIIYSKSDNELQNAQLARPKGKFVIPDGTTAIAQNAFINCSMLTEIDIPKTIKEIGEDPFDGCDSLKAINVHAPKNSFKCYNDLGNVVPFEKIVPKGVQVNYIDSSKPEVEVGPTLYNRTAWQSHFSKSTYHVLRIADKILNTLNSACSDYYSLVYYEGYIGMKCYRRACDMVTFYPQEKDLLVSISVKQTPEFDRIMAEKLNELNSYKENHYHCHIQEDDIEQKSGLFSKLFKKDSNKIEALIPIFVQAEKEMKEKQQN